MFKLFAARSTGAHGLFRNRFRGLAVLVNQLLERGGIGGPQRLADRYRGGGKISCCYPRQDTVCLEYQPRRRRLGLRIGKLLGH